MKTQSMQIEKYLRIKQVMEIIPFSKTKIYSLIKENKFPKQIKVGGNAIWRETDIKKYSDEIKNEFLK